MVKIYCLNETDFKDLKLYSELVGKLMINYECLINSRLIDFYIDDSFSKLPIQWQTYLKKLEPADLSKWLNNEKVTNVNQVSPLSLICFQKLGHLFRFKRTESNLNEFDEIINRINAIKPIKPIKSKQDHTLKYKIIDLNQLNLKNIFLRHLKRKKIHEVGRFSSFISNILDPKDVELIDIGSGKGHLDRLLSIYNGFQITSLELESNNSAKADSYDQQAVNELKKLPYLKNQIENLNLNKPKYFNIKVTNDLDLIGSLKIQDDKKIGIVGLHACGNLSIDLVNIFKDGFVDYLFLISCCYHKKKDSDGRILLSKFVNNLNLNFTHETKELANHSIENHIDALKGTKVSF